MPNDPYIDQATGVLRNKLGATTARDLQRLEFAVSWRRRLQLNVTNTSFDLRHLQEIHRHLFHDVYDWAGELRTVNISKGGSTFHDCNRLIEAGNCTFGKLHKGDLLSPHVSDGDFARQAAVLLNDINYMHPFREGNGRTQRAFLDEVAAVSGRRLSWRHVAQSEHALAAMESFRSNDPAVLEPIIWKAMAPPTNGASALGRRT